MSKAFRGLHDVAEVEAKTAALAKTAAVRDQIHDEEDQAARQRKFDVELATLIQAERQGRQERISGVNEDNSATDSPDPAVRRRQILSDLRRQAAAAEDSGNRRVARRVLEGQFIGLIEHGTEVLRNQKDYGEAVRTFLIATEVNPDRAGAFYYLSWAYAAKGDKKKALLSLKAAVEKGFKDRSALAGNTAFDALRNDPAFLRLVEKMVQFP